jgi:hypothetical protein
MTGETGKSLRTRRVNSVALLEVDDLHVSFRTSDGIVQALRGVRISGRAMLEGRDLVAWLFG